LFWPLMQPQGHLSIWPPWLWHFYGVAVLTVIMTPILIPSLRYNELALTTPHPALPLWIWLDK
jgi:hypothetical protein